MAILSLVFLIGAIVLGFFRKTNMGLVAFGLALWGSHVPLPPAQCLLHRPRQLLALL